MTDITVVSQPVIIETANQVYVVDVSSVGVQGATGSAGQINSVSASSLSAGSSPTVVNNGTITNAQLAFGIPTGNTGAQGNQGAGYDGVSSTTSNTLAVGSKTFALTTTLGYHAYIVGSFVRVINSVSNYMYGTVTAVSASSMTVNVVSAVGAYGSTFTSWTFSLTGTKGDTGATGQGFTYRSAWVSGTSYAAYDVVTYAGSTYVCILAVSGTTIPSSDTSHWTLTASKGDKGDTGTAATATAGSTSTVDGYTSALVTNSGSTSAAVFDFRIPNGVAIGTTSPTNLGVLWADTNTSPTITAINGGTA